jgi:hypothetical protein
MKRIMARDADISYLVPPDFHDRRQSIILDRKWLSAQNHAAYLFGAGNFFVD